MANEISWRHSATGKTLYATIRDTLHRMWDGATVETLTVANWGNYDIALTESPSGSYFYAGTFPPGGWPDGLPAGFYWVDIFEQVGASPAIGDTLVATLLGYWNGTTFKPQAGDTTQFAGQTITCAAGVTVLASVGTAATSTAQTGDAFARLGAPAGASIAADIAAVPTTQEISDKLMTDFAAQSFVYYVTAGS